MKKGQVFNVDIDDVNPSLKGMYKDYFLDYASYVILERAVPYLEDGLKPVQRRILHALKQMDDGRFHKVANVIGQTMQYHPHGDAAIGGALVHLGQKNYLLDTQGNWGDPRTGDGAAAPRYIEVRLTKFALEVGFNPLTTDWQLSYDGRKKEPIELPMKFPLLLAHGVEGIAVGLSTKILPHNFIELIKASIKILEDKKVKIYPDFQSGGMIDVTDYQSGKRGGKVKVRARIQQADKNVLTITELPYGVTTTVLIDSIIKANDKGKIKIKKVIDNTAKDVEVRIELGSGISPELTIDALYAFTNCEVSISPNACVVHNDKPLFLGVEDILKESTARTKALLKLELEIQQRSLEEKWHSSSLEKIFIEKRIYRDIEECENWEEVLTAIDIGLKKYVATPSDKAPKNDTRLKLNRDITTEDIVKLTEIKIKRISKFNTFKQDELIQKFEDDLKQVKHDLAHLTEFAIAYFTRILEKYKKGRERKTEITTFETIKAVKVVANNSKLYVNRKDGFIGHGIKKEEFVSDCSDIDDIIVIRKDGKMMVSRISDKVFVGKNILHVGIWKKGDERTTYNLVYVDAGTGRGMAKRFNVKAITRDKEYDLTKGAPGSKTLYLTSNPNGESEIVQVQLSPGSKAKKKVFEFDFEDIAIKGRSAGGNIITRYPVRKITQISVGTSSLGAIHVWMDEVSGRINTEQRGKYLGGFDTGSKILALYSNGSYELTDLNLDSKFEASKISWIGCYHPDMVVSVIYYDGEKEKTMVKRFQIETSTIGQKFLVITDHKSSKQYYATADRNPVVTYAYKANNKKNESTININDFIEVKGWKALGNRVTDYKITSISKAESDPVIPSYEHSISLEKPKSDEAPKTDKSDNIALGDTIEFDVDEKGQSNLFDDKD